MPGTREAAVNIGEWGRTREAGTCWGASLWEERCLPSVPALPDCGRCGPVPTGRGSFYSPSGQPAAVHFVVGVGPLEHRVSVSLSVIVSPPVSVCLWAGLHVASGSPAPGCVLARAEGKAETDKWSVRQEGVGQNPGRTPVQCSLPVWPVAARSQEGSLSQGPIAS